MVFKCGKKKGKRYLALAVLLCVMFMASSVFAEGPTRLGPNQRVQMYVIDNPVDTTSSNELSTNVATTTIVPTYDRILGYTIQPSDLSKTSERFVALYDATSAAGTYDMSTTYLFDEFEASEAGDINTRWYCYPRQLLYGLSVRQGPNTTVIIYYEDTRQF